ncbi:Putative aminoglycoside phosphotransferase [Minicystis rosea]|nr:Putative aminoglycoside phosphotransferase [Minicystis rosea]
MSGRANITGVVTEVRAAHRFDEGALQRWLAGKLPGADVGIRVHQFEGGQSNPTFLLETSAGRWVLRKKPGGPLLASAHMVEREQRVLTALAGSGVPVPEVPLFTEDASIIGTPFYVMSYVHGRIARDPSLPGLSPTNRRATYFAAVEALATLHDVDWAARGLSDFGKPGAYVSRQLARWSKQYASSKSRDLPAMEWLVDWLPRRIPAESKTTITHGDYRLDNLVLHPTEPKILAVLDWELSTLGEPLTDLAYFCIQHHLGQGERGLRGLIGHDRDALGIPSQRELVEAYAAQRGIGIPSEETMTFYLVFGLFRLAAIVVGIEARVRQGNASSDRAHDIAAQAETFAETARRLAEAT